MEDPDNGRIILKWILNKWDGGMDRIDLFQSTETWRALLDVVMNLRVPLTAGIFLTRFLA
jgi:hypothetical protein